MKKHYKLIILALTLVQTSLALEQLVKSPARVSGIILDDKSKPLPYATVALLKAKDSTILKGAITNDAGLDAFDHLTPGQHLVRVTTLGFSYSRRFDRPQDDNLNPFQYNLDAYTYEGLCFGQQWRLMGDDPSVPCFQNCCFGNTKPPNCVVLGGICPYVLINFRTRLAKSAMQLLRGPANPT